MVVVHRSYIPTYRTEGAPHLRAKRRVARWLLSLAGEPPRYSVIQEYPFTEGGGGVRLWSSCGYAKKPSRLQLQKREGAVICICDVVIAEDGIVTHAFEVVHSNITPPWKSDWLRSNGVEVLQIYADELLSGADDAARLDEIARPA